MSRPSRDHAARTLYLGIDGGGTRTRAFVCDETGAHAAWGESGPTNPNHVGAAEVGRHLAEATRRACGRLNATPAAVTSAFLGIAGLTENSGRERMRRWAIRSGLIHARVGVDHDIRIALAGGLEGRPGIALIVGTGSSCYGRDAAGHTWQTGGWESLVSDEGSGYHLGREAIIAAIRMADGRAPKTLLRRRVFDHLGIREVAQILQRLHRPPIRKPEVAGLAPLVIELAEAGDAAAREILRRGARLLGELVAANHRQLPTGPGPEVVVTGGLGTADRWYRRLIYAAIRRQLPTARVRPPALAPAIGAALLAIEQAGQPLSPRLLENLKRRMP